MNKNEKRLIQFIARCVLYGSGSMSSKEVEEMRELALRPIPSTPPSAPTNKPCACGCGEPVAKMQNKFIQGHSRKGAR